MEEEKKVFVEKITAEEGCDEGNKPRRPSRKTDNIRRFAVVNLSIFKDGEKSARHAEDFIRQLQGSWCITQGVKNGESTNEFARCRADEGEPAEPLVIKSFLRKDPLKEA